MYIISLNTEIGLTKDKKKEGEFVDKSLGVKKEFTFINKIHKQSERILDEKIKFE